MHTHTTPDAHTPLADNLAQICRRAAFAWKMTRLVALLFALLQLSSAFVLTDVRAGALRRRSAAPAMGPKFKTGDTVEVITGDDKGESGKIISIDMKKSKVVVEGLNMQTKHVSPGRGL